jgi:hypothetical protein
MIARAAAAPNAIPTGVVIAAAIPNAARTPAAIAPAATVAVVTLKSVTAGVVAGVVKKLQLDVPLPFKVSSWAITVSKYLRQLSASGLSDLGITIFLIQSYSYTRDHSKCLIF